LKNWKKEKDSGVVKENIKKLKERIEEVCRRIGRESKEIEIVAVSKGFGEDKIREAIEAGIKKIGENRVQEALPKIEVLGRVVDWHMVGHVQSNKVKKVVKYFDFIQSLDSIKLAGLIQKEAKKINKKVPVLVEVNTSGEETKYGVSPSFSFSLVEKVLECENLKFMGLMTVGPLTQDKEKIRKSFRLLRKLKEEMEDKFRISIFYLSMGMTDDFEIAIEEGSNMLRIGRGIFGEREN